MKKNLLFVLLFILIVQTIQGFPNISNLSNEGVNIEFKIHNWGVYPGDYTLVPEDYHIVGDYFWYEINFMANENVEDELIIKIYSPSGESIYNDSFILNLTKGESTTFESKSRIKEGNLLALPFEQEGDYKISVCSPKGIIFYKWFIKLYDSNSGKIMPIWEKTCTNYFFGVMSQSDYRTGEEQKSRIDKTITQGENMAKLTNWLIFLTIILLFIELINVLSERGKRNLFLYTVFVLLPAMIVLAIITFSLWLAYNEFGFPWNVITTFVIAGFIFYILKSKSFREGFMMKNLFKESEKKS